MELRSIKIIKSMQKPNGLFVAAADPNTHYSKQAWIRDNVYSAIGLEKYDLQSAIKTYQALLDVIKKHEYKIDWAIREKPDAKFKYIHARFNPETFEELPGNWGNMQNDSIGAFLFKIGELEKRGIKVLRDEHDLIVVQKLVHYLQSIEYWHDEDNGVWEENEEIHASSVGACVAGLFAVKELVIVPEDLIQKGKNALNFLLPRESITKEVDLAQLSLIYPFNVVSEEQKRLILENIEKKLVRQKGVIRYIGDKYYSNGSEANWVFGFPWLAKIYKDLGNNEKFNQYMKKTREVQTEKGELPELYFAETEEHNENSPLAWSHAMYLIATAE